MFEKFQDYMYYLLASPLKKVLNTKNQFYILLKVLGSHFDDLKQLMFKMREEALIISASEKVLDLHGKDRNMTRLKGEDVESFRTRLIMKSIVSEKAGTNEGILLAVKSLGYLNSVVEPFYLYDAERWAEFIVFLASNQQIGINDLKIIDSVVMAVKPASARPSYGIQSASKIITKTESNYYPFDYPICNILVCGTHPESQAVGKAFDTVINANSEFKTFDIDDYRCNTFYAGEEN